MTFTLDIPPESRVFARFYGQMFRELAMAASMQKNQDAVDRIKVCEHSQFTLRDIAEIAHMLGKKPTLRLDPPS